jgi:hypothetical protein
MAVHRAPEQEEAPFDPGEVLRRYARRLNLRRFRIPLLPPDYHLLGDYLFWWDESPPWDRWELRTSLGYLFHFRTGLILGDARPWAEFWELGRRLFPCWVGFHPSRCRRSRRLARVFRSARLEATRTLHRSIRELQREGP